MQKAQQTHIINKHYQPLKMQKHDTDKSKIRWHNTFHLRNNDDDDDDDDDDDECPITFDTLV